MVSPEFTNHAVVTPSRRSRPRTCKICATTFHSEPTVALIAGAAYICVGVGVAFFIFMVNAMLSLSNNIFSILWNTFLLGGLGVLCLWAAYHVVFKRPAFFYASICPSCGAKLAHHEPIPTEISEEGQKKFANAQKLLARCKEPSPALDRIVSTLVGCILFVIPLGKPGTVTYYFDSSTHCAVRSFHSRYPFSDSSVVSDESPISKFPNRDLGPHCPISPFLVKCFP